MDERNISKKVAHYQYHDFNEVWQNYQRYEVQNFF